MRGQAWPSIGHFDPMTFIQYEPARLPQDAATQQQDQLPRRARASLGLLGASALLFTLGACGSGGGSGGSKNAFGTPGEVGDKPGGGFYIVDGNQAGNAQEPRLVRQSFGRLVEVYGFNSMGMRVPMASKFVIDQDLIPDGQDFFLETNPITAQQNLLILRDVEDLTPGGGREQFFALLKKSEATLGVIQSEGAGNSGVYSMVPRNAVIVVQFDDLIDASTLNPTTFRVKVGNPPEVPFEGRLLADPNHGDLADFNGDGSLEFYTTRVIFDPTVTEVESFETNPPLPVNGVGLPPASEVSLANICIHIPTKLNAAFGQTKLLLNPSGHPITSKNNGPVDYSSPTIDVVRAARSGGPTEVTSDDYNGFLRDDESPRVVGATPMFITSQPTSTNGYDEFVIPSAVFTSAFCTQVPQPGDVLRQPGVFAEVLEEPGGLSGQEVTDLRVRLVVWPRDWDAPGLGGPLEWELSAVGEADFLAAYDPTEDVGREVCFVRIFPRPKGFPDDPSAGLYTSSTLAVRFSEPMDPTSVTAFDSLTLTRDPDPVNTSDFVVGSMTQSLDLQEFTFVPDLPLAHEEGSAESYYLRINTGELGSNDLAGNTLSSAMAVVAASIAPDEKTEANGGRVSRFTALDEEPPFGDEISGPLPEWTGQHLYDLDRELIKPRPVVHFNSVADRSRAVIKLMTPFTIGVQTPLSGLGSKMQTLWRYIDFGFALTDRSTHNLDIEGMYWSPTGGSVVAETFNEFEIELTHSFKAPDEYIDPDSLFPQYPSSGLVDKFVKNILDKKGDPLTVMHPRGRGYSVNPGDLYVSEVSGTKFMPWPWNRDVGPDEFTTWTWRNTDIRKRGGNQSGGSDPDILYTALGIAQPCNKYYREGNIRTIGLPVLMAFSCFPDSGATGVNAFDISLAANSSSKPYFRAFSTGGIDQSGNKILVDPDTETEANGGFNPGSNPPGKKTFGLDNTFYIGAADFVTRVSRTHSLWFQAINPLTGSLFENPLYIDPTMEPAPADQPNGTRVVLAYRGVHTFNPQPWSCDENISNLDPIENANSIDAYGDHYDDACLPPDEATCVFIPNHNPIFENKGLKMLDKNDEWRDTIAGINTASYYQVRITFEANIFTGLVPELSALAVAWYE